MPQKDGKAEKVRGQSPLLRGGRCEKPERGGSRQLGHFWLVSVNSSEPTARPEPTFHSPRNADVPAFASHFSVRLILYSSFSSVPWKETG